jgi:hypothetical protein
MIILKPNVIETQHFQIILKNGLGDFIPYMVFENKATKVLTFLQALDISVVKDITHITIEDTSFLFEGNTYSLNIVNNVGSLIYKDLIFCTIQDVQYYSINNGQYDFPPQQSYPFSNQDYVFPNVDNNEYILPNIDNNNYIVI